MSNATIKSLYVFARCIPIYTCGHNVSTDNLQKGLADQITILKTFCAYLYPSSGEGGVHPGHPVDSSSLSSDCNQTHLMLGIKRASSSVSKRHFLWLPFRTFKCDFRLILCNLIIDWERKTRHRELMSNIKGSEHQIRGFNTGILVRYHHPW